MAKAREKLIRATFIGTDDYHFKKGRRYSLKMKGNRLIYKDKHSTLTIKYFSFALLLDSWDNIKNEEMPF